MRTSREARSGAIGLRVLFVVAVLVPALAGGCQKLDIPDGFPCSESGECPSPYQCVAQKCYRQPPPDAGDGGVDHGLTRDAGHDAHHDAGHADGNPDRPATDAGHDAFVINECDGGNHICGSTCVDSNSTDHCGSLCVACPQVAGTTPTCDGKTCDFTCTDSTQKKCGSKCVSGCCTDDDCPPQNGQTGSCDTSSNTCSYNCPSTAPKACGSACIATSACCVDSDCTAMTGEVASCNTSTHVCAYTCGTGYKACSDATCVLTSGCCADTECAAMAGPGQVGTCSTSTHSCSFSCTSTTQKCGQLCIGTSSCCLDTDCPVTGGQVGHCDSSTHSCNYTCTSTTKPCNGACIAAANCCTNNDCTPAAGQVGTCGSGGSCSYACATGYKTCSGSTTCVPTSYCCTSADCSPGTGQTASCNASTGACSYGCATNYKACGSNACIPNANCCTNNDCSPGTGQVGTCNALTGACQYSCTTTYKPCGTNTCIPSGNCCSSSDCNTPPVTGEVGTCNTSTGACGYACGNGFKNCNNVSCIASGLCCSSSDCAPVAGATAFCTSANQCTYTCNATYLDCGNGTCVAAGGCCTSADCPSKTNATAACNSSHQCAYTCATSYTDCGGGTCTNFSTGGCCSAGDCAAKSGATAACNSSHQCAYTCTGSGGLSCSDGSCAPSGGCCTSSDCPAKSNATAACNSSHQCAYTCATSYTDCGGGTCTNFSTGGCCSAGDCAAKTGATAACNSSHQCAYTCTGTGVLDCGGGVCVASGGCCTASDCAARSGATITCNSSHQCIYACSASSPKLGCQCSSPGATACNGADMKLTVSCTGGQWVAGTTCSSTQNCDETDGTCHNIITQCVGQSPGYTFCGTNDTPTTCGPDLTTVTTATPCAGKCLNGVCQAPVCGDGKVESGEQCDDGNTTPLDGCEPVTAPIASARCTTSKVLSLALGDQHTCALYNGGYVRCWGDNSVGELGLGLMNTNFEGNTQPYLIPPVTFATSGGATALAAGNNFTCAVLSDGSVQCWGTNSNGELGQGSTAPTSSGQASVVSLGQSATGITVSRSLGLACAVLADGSVRCWGSNASGALGLGNNTAFPSMTMTPSQFGPVSLGTTATGIAGSNGACALLTGGTIRCWGDNNFGELGLGVTTAFSNTMVPSAYGAVPLPSGKTALSIAMGTGFACTRLNDGSAQCWGRNNVGQLGIGTTNTVGDNEVATIGAVVLGTTVSNLVAGVTETCGLFASDGGWRCWGSNANGELGYPDLTTRGSTSTTTPNQLTALTFGTGRTATAIFLGNGDACALLDDNEVRCWGNNASGQLGLGMVSSAPTYVGGDSTHTPNNTTDTVQALPPS
ncbi:MAG TPA: hypothetical protein VKZ18_21380 [Polyangia bacterium]|nr:hypothetical protein [Polyangia bacterium]